MMTVVVAVVIVTMVIVTVVMAMVVMPVVMIVLMMIVALGELLFLIEEVLLQRWVINLLLCFFLSMAVATASTLSMAMIMLTSKMVMAFT